MNEIEIAKWLQVHSYIQEITALGYFVRLDICNDFSGEFHIRPNTHWGTTAITGRSFSDISQLKSELQKVLNLVFTLEEERTKQLPDKS